MLKNVYKTKCSVLVLACVSYMLAASLVWAVAQDKSPDVPDPANTASHTTLDGQAAAVSFGEYLSGRFAESEGDTENGIRFLRESLKNSPDNPELLLRLYRMLLSSGQIEEAISVAKTLDKNEIAEEGSELTPRMLLAFEAVRQGQYEEADDYVNAVSKKGLNALMVPLMHAWLQVGMNTMKTPIDTKLILPEGKILLPHIALHAAFINDIAGFTPEAQAQYELAVSDPRIVPFRAVEALVNFYDRHAMKDKSDALVSGYLAAHSDAFVADELLQDTATKQSTRLVSNAREGVAEILYTVANIFHGVRAPADEIATLRAALYLRADFPAAQFLLASTFEDTQKYNEAIAVYKTINKHTPYYERGLVRSLYDTSELQGSDKEDILKQLDALAAAHPKALDAILAKGDILRSLNRFNDAVDAYSAAIARIKEPQKYHWVIFFSRAASYDQAGQWEKAEKDMQKALELDPGNPEILNYLGYSWLEKRINIAEAKKMIEAAYDARPEDPHIIDSMGFLLYMSGDYANAIEYFQQALERTPDDPTVNEHLGDAYWQLKRPVEARYQWQRALDNNPDENTKHDLQHKIDKGMDEFHPLQAEAPAAKSAEAPVVTQAPAAPEATPATEE